jgi:hypothetical protein
MKTNGAVSLLDNADDLGLALLTAVDVDLANNANEASDDFAVPGKCTLLALVDLVSGELKVDLDYFVAGTAHTFSSPVKTVTINSTTSGSAVRDYFAHDFDAASGKDTAGIKITAGSSGARVHEFLVMVITEREAGEDWNGCPDVLHNAVQSTVTGDGSGVVSRAPNADRERKCIN